MKLRSLDADSVKITLGAALLLINAHLDKKDTSTQHRIDFFDQKNNRWFSVEGNKNEIDIVNSLYLIIGPSRPLELLNAVPVSFRQLRDRKINPVANREGIVHVLENLNHIKVHSCWESDVRAFNEWLKNFELAK